MSILVISYNSEDFILETLESSKRQTYPNLELIISDDCSTDNTVEICTEWLKRNDHYFLTSQIITIDKNSGIPANCNRAIKASTGSWIKIIAGDDILLDDCIENNIEFSKNNSKASFIFSNVQCFSLIDNHLVDTDSILCNKKVFNYDSHNQYLHLIKFGLFFGVPSTFIRKEALKEIGYLDESIFLGESYPTYIRATKNGYKLFCLDKYTVRYRIRNSSISNAVVISKDFLDTIHLIIKKYRLPYLWKHDFLFAYDLYITMIVESKIYTNKHSLYKMLLWTSPRYIYRKLRSEPGAQFSKYNIGI